MTDLSYAQVHTPGKMIKSIDFFIGEWDITNYRMTQGGKQRSGKARSKAYYILDRTAIQDEYYAIDLNGNVIFRGISVRSYNPELEQFQVMWIVPGVQTMTDIIADWKDGQIVAHGKGYDAKGEYLEKLIYYNISDSTYSMKLDRSYDDGKNWIENFGMFDAKKTND